ncbi:MAG: DUF1150 family protein [Pseudomonadota bacterium]
MANKRIDIFATATEFAQFGKQAFGYIRAVKSDDMNARFPDQAELPEGLDLWGLFAADGEPLALADERSVIMENAGEMELMPLTRH